MAKQGNEIDALDFAELLDEIVRLLSMCGTALGFAFAGKQAPFAFSVCLITLSRV